MEPNPAWDAVAHEETVEALSEEGLVFKIWGADWCGDCRKQLPDFAAALDAAGVPGERIEQFPVDRDKEGPGVEAYGVEFIPTVVVERDGAEVARFVEAEPVSIAVFLADQLTSADASA
jgi:thioredoxin-like negative regulator of GroEL